MRWKYKWILSLTSIMALVFLVINIFRPEIHNRVLMPAPQSGLVHSACNRIHVFLRIAGVYFLLALAGLIRPSLSASG